MGKMDTPFTSAKSFRMPTVLLHRRTRIITLETGELPADHGRPGDIILQQQDDGWWTHFVADDGSLDSYDAPAETYNQALWTAKAAAEFDSAE